MNLPVDFITRTKQLLGKEWDSFLMALSQPSPVSIRLNKAKTDTILPDPVAWCQTGFYLDKRPQFTFDPLFHAGCYYVQEPSSMFISQIIDKFQKENLRILDLCAAPGGKSTLIAGLLDNDSLLVSNEVIRSRANILVENMAKWGKPNVVVTNNDPAQIGRLAGYFDIILVDAPCSGEGMFRKDEGAISEWSIDNVRLCKERQQRILADIWPALKEDGILIYSTCTYNLEENEENVKWVCDTLGAENLSIKTEENWNITPSMSDNITAYRFSPHKVMGEGFFCAVLRKTGTSHQIKQVKGRKNNKPKSDISADYKNYLSANNRFTFYTRNHSWFAAPDAIYNDIELLRGYLNILSEGICLGEFKGKDFIPSQSLALSNALNTNAFPIHEIDWETAIRYLRKEALIIEEQPKGYILLIYNDMPLGFVKNIGNRANNLYPQEWRIRSTNIPNEIVNIIG